MSHTTDGELGTHLPKKPKKEKEKTFVASIRFNGKLRQRRFPNTPEGKLDGKEWVAELRGIKARWQAGLEVTQDISLGDYCKLFLSRKTRATQMSYESPLNIMVFNNPELRNLKMNEAKKMHFQHLFADNGVLKKSGIADITFNTRLSILRTVFQEAMREEVPYALSNPLLLFKKSKVQKKPWKALQGKEEATQILTLAEERLDGRDYPVIFLCMNSGARISSVLGWRWKDVDFEKRTLSFVQMFTRDSKTNFVKKGIKSRPGEVRVHAMSEGLTQYLVELQAKSDWNGREDFVVSGKTRTVPLMYCTARRRLLDFAKGYEARYGKKIDLNFHKFRHTFAVNYLTSGGRIEELKEFLDHCDIKTTQVYGKVQAENLHKQANIVSFQPARKSDDRVLTLISSN